VLLIFLGFSFYTAQKDASLLSKDIKKLDSELKKRNRRYDEMIRLQEENAARIEDLNIMDRKIITNAGLVHTFSLIQKYLPEDLWVSSIEIEESDREGFARGREKQPVIRVRGSGREMGRPLTDAYTEFQIKLDRDPLTRGISSQRRLGEDFSFSLLINYSVFPEEPETEEEEAEE
jgi:hypothetical protein